MPILKKQNIGPTYTRDRQPTRLLLVLCLVIGQQATVVAQYAPERVIYEEGVDAANVVALETSDLDMDGDQDIIVASSADHKVSWYENDGNGDFGPQKIISNTSMGVSSIVIADFNDDNIPDVLVGSAADDHVAWYQNDGAGNFSEIKLITGSAVQVTSVIAADFDNDDDLDVMASSFSQNKIAWYENLGNGLFGAETIVSLTIDGPRKIAAADVNMDGYVDILAGAYNTDRLIQHLNLGDGNFDEGIILSDGINRIDKIVVGDINNDESPDVLIAGGSGFQAVFPGLIYFPNNGIELDSPAIIIDATAQFLRDIHLVDLHNNGLLDIVASDFQSGDLFLYQNQGNGVFSSRTSISYNGHTAASVTSSDLNGDGNQDIITEYGNSIIWYDNTDILSPEQEGISFAEGVPGIQHVIPLHVNADDQMDVISATSLGLMYHRNNGGGFFLGGQLVNQQNSSSYVTAGHFDEDGKTDLISLSRSYNNITLNIQIVEGVYETRNISNNLHSPTSALFMDVNNDGKEDIVACSRDHEKLTWYDHNDIVNYEPTITTLFADGMFRVRVAITADLDGDGLIDGICAMAENGKIGWSRNNGDGSFSEIVLHSWFNVDVISLDAVDLDRDGDIDLVVGTDEVIFLLTNDGNENFTSSFIDGTVIRINSVAVLDYDNDLDPDVVFTVDASGFRKLALAVNDGTGNFEEPATLSDELSRYYRVKTEDLNNDDNTDIIFYAYDQFNFNAVWWMKNLGNGSFESADTILPEYVNDYLLRDLDWDNDLDLLYIVNNNPLKWASNDGNGNFGIPEQLYPGFTHYVDMADMDNDGDNDLLIDEYDPEHQIFWLENDGSENFMEKHIITSAFRYPRYFAGDMDDDDDLDLLAYSPAGSNSNSIFGYVENFDNGRFDIEQIVDQDLGRIVNTVEVDLNNDSVMDLVTATNHINGTLRTHINSSNGTFDEGVWMEGAYIDVSLITADMDNDGDDDLIASSSWEVYWYDNHGDGQLTEFPILSLTQDYGINNIIATDVDGNGFSDVIISNWNTNSIIIAYNYGGNNFSDPIIISDNINNPNTLTSGDLDGDGDEDILAHSSDDVKYIWFENVDGAFILHGSRDRHSVNDWRTNSTTMSKEYSFAIIDDDLNEDIVFSHTTTGTSDQYFQMIQGDREGDFDAPIALSSLVNSSNDSKFWLVDANNDDYTDLVQQYNNDQIITFLNLGDGTFMGPGLITSFEPLSQINILEVADLDDDGFTDILCLVKTPDNVGDNFIAVLFNNGTGAFLDFVLVEDQALGDLSYPSIKLGDVDGDGDQDIVGIFILSDMILFHYLNNGNRNFGNAIAQTVATPQDAYPSQGRIDLADLSGDGDDEIFGTYLFILPCPLPHCPYIYYYHYRIYDYNQGQLEEIAFFNVWPHGYNTAANGLLDMSMVYADYNGDNNIDLLTVGTDKDDIIWLLGDGQGSFPEFELVADQRVFHEIPRLRAVDFDRDGDLDVFNLNAYDLFSRIDLYENLTPREDEDNDGFDFIVDCDDMNPEISDTIPSAVVLPLDALCEGGAVMFDLLEVLNNANYEWTGPENFTSIDAEPVIDPVSSTQTGDYYVVVQFNECESPPSTTYLEVYPSPEVIISQAGDLLQAEGDDISTYQWMLNGNPIDGANSSEYLAEASGDYSVHITDANDCENLSDAISVIISGINDHSANHLFSVYPNPVIGSDKLYVSSSVYLSDLNYSIINTSGQIIQNGQLQNSPSAISLDQIESGIYLLQIMGDQTQVAARLSIVN